MSPEYEFRFDVVWFGGPRSSPLREKHFERLNSRTAGGRGHFLVMPTTLRQAQVEAKGNLLAQYYGELNQVRRDQPTWPVVTSSQMADRILRAHHDAGFHTGWIFLNEISAKLWPGKREYRAWVIDVARRLALRGYSPVVFSPFPAPPARFAADWAALAEHAYIGAEHYLNGQAIAEQGASAVAWCEAQYRKTKNAYIRNGVPERRIFLTEHFGHTKLVGTVRRGRCSVTLRQWLRAIDARSTAARTVAFGGYVSYAWMYNQMGVPEAELLRCTDAYLAKPLP